MYCQLLQNNVLYPYAEELKREKREKISRLLNIFDLKYYKYHHLTQMENLHKNLQII